MFSLCDTPTAYISVSNFALQVPFSYICILTRVLFEGVAIPYWPGFLQDRALCVRVGWNQAWSVQARVFYGLGEYSSNAAKQWCHRMLRSEVRIVLRCMCKITEKELHVAL